MAIYLQLSNLFSHFDHKYEDIVSYSMTFFTKKSCLQLVIALVELKRQKAVDICFDGNI